MKHIPAFVFLLAIGCGSGKAPPPLPSTPETATVVVAATPEPEPLQEAKPALLNAIYTPLTEMPKPNLKVERLTLPTIPNGSAVWGATGRDSTGNIYVGVCCEGTKPVAHLVTYNPMRGAWADLGPVTTDKAISQAKIHTKIMQANDGYLYFASMDEEGEKEDGSQLPTHGSYLFRMKPGDAKWEKLKHVPEGVLASGTNGRYVYFLGYFGHVLYQWDTTKSQWATVKVGSFGRHICRNVLVDSKGHVYVPRVKATDARLVEYDEYLVEVKSTKLEGYSISNDADSHGIVGVANMKNGGVCFTTDQGRLYRITPQAGGSAVEDIGNIHPQGRSYPAGLFCVDGERYLLGFASMPGRKDMEYEAIVYDLDKKTAVATPITFPTEAAAKSILVYGSTTRDDAGAFYLVGRYSLAGAKVTNIPCVWRVMFN